MSLKSGFFTAAYSRVTVRGHEDGDAAGCAVLAAKGVSASIDRNVYLVADRVNRNGMGACHRGRVGILANGIRSLVNDAEYWSNRIAADFVIRLGKEVVVVAGIVPNPSLPFRPSRLRTKSPLSSLMITDPFPELLHPRRISRFGPIASP